MQWKSAGGKVELTNQGHGCFVGTHPPFGFSVQNDVIFVNTHLPVRPSPAHLSAYNCYSRYSTVLVCKNNRCRLTSTLGDSHQWDASIHLHTRPQAPT